MKTTKLIQLNSRVATEKIDPTQMLSLAVWLRVVPLLFQLGWVRYWWIREGEAKTDPTQ